MTRDNFYAIDSTDKAAKTATASAINSKQTQMDQEVWSIECTVEELQLDLCRTKEEITIDQGFYVNGQRSVKRITIRKYNRQARELMKWIPIARPVPEFVINASDLSPKVIEELNVRVDNPDTVGYILKQAVGRVFEKLRL